MRRGGRSIWAWAVTAGLCGGLAVLARTTGLALLAAAGLFALVAHGRSGRAPCALGRRRCLGLPAMGLDHLPGISIAFLFIY